MSKITHFWVVWRVGPDPWEVLIWGPPNSGTVHLDPFGTQLTWFATKVTT